MAIDAKRKDICRVPFVDLHKTKYLIIDCSDARFERGTKKMRSIEEIEPADRITIPGAGKRIAERNPDALNDVKLLVEKHGIKEIYIIHHSGCAAYAIAGKSFLPEEIEKEEQFHTEQLLKIKAVLNEIVPAVKVSLRYAKVIGGITHYLEI